MDAARAGRARGHTPIERSLVGLRRLARSALALEAIAIVLTALVGSAIGVALFDYLFVAPAGLRWVVWGAGLAVGAWTLLRLVRSALRFRPSLPDLALRVEATPEADRRGLRGVLASGLEFARADRPLSGTEAALASQVVRQATERFSPSLVLPVLRPRRPARRVGALAGLVLLVLGAWLVWPTLVRVGATRVLAPWAGAMWPTTTAVANATADGAHDMGRPLALEADLTKTDRAPGQTRVWASYRLWLGDTAGPVRRVAMMHQPGDALGDEAPDAPGSTPERYTWLHADLAGEATAIGQGQRPVEFEVEYWFQTADAQTEPARVLVVEPPMVVGARVEVEPPLYVQDGQRADLPYLVGALDLGPGIDERARTAPILEGSTITLSVTFNKPLGGAYTTPQGVLAGFGAPLTPHDATASIQGATWTLRAVVGLPPAATPTPGAASDSDPIAPDPAQGIIELPVRVADRHGLRSDRESMFRLTIARDQDPTASVTEPPSDESVLATAVVDLTGEGSDDAGVRAVALEVQRAASPAGSEGASPEPIGAARAIAQSDPLERIRRQRVVSTRLDLSTQGLRVGDELWIVARAEDTYAMGPLGHEAARSAPRRLRIISQTELIDQVRQDLAGVREAAIRLDDAQARLLASVTASGATTDTARAQAGVTSTLDDQRRFVERLAQRLERNNLDDPALSTLVQDVAQSLGQASSSSERATGRLDEALRDQEEAPEQDPRESEQTERIGQEQQHVRDELQRLAAMLDRGSDGWLVRREIERLLEQQRALQQDTQAAGAATAGRPADSLSPDERTELERIAQRQLELAQQAQASIDELAQRARELQEADPGQAAGLRSAAQTGRERQVPQNLSEASENIQRNNTNTAAQQQQEAIDALQEMLEDIDEGQQNRDQTLQRVLADLVASLDALIVAQEGELSRLGAFRASVERAAPGRPAPAPEGTPLDRAMIALHTNTLGVVDQIRTGYPELTSVARLLGAAATAQTDAVGALRAEPKDLTLAQDSEEVSLSRLREARAEAQRMQEQAAQRENARKRRELRQAYRGLLEQQVALRGDVEPYAGLDLSRRQRAEVRALGERQESVRVALEGVLNQTAELAEAPVFALAHRRLDSLLGVAGGALREGRADGPVLTRQQQAADILRSLYESLEDSSPQQSPFESAGGGGGGGQGGGGSQEPPVIMPIFELRLLRGMQQQALDLTRDLDALGNRANPNEIDEIAGVQRLLAEEASALVQRMQTQQPPTAPTSGREDRP